MTRALVLFAVLGVSAIGLTAQEPKAVPKDSLRVSIPGCTKGAVFTAARKTADQPGNVDVPEGMHLHMNGPKKLMQAIKLHEGSVIEITGVVRRDALQPEGLNLGKGVRISPGTSTTGGGATAGVPVSQQVQIDVEGWRQLAGQCRVK